MSSTTTRTAMRSRTAIVFGVCSVLAPAGLLLFGNDPSTGQFTLETIKDHYEDCRDNSGLSKPSNESRALVYAGANDEWVAVTLVTHSKSLKRGKNHGGLADLEKGRWMGHILSYGTSNMPDYDVIGTDVPSNPTITCVWVGKGPQSDQLSVIFIGPDKKPKQYVFRHEDQAHKAPIADFQEERRLMDQMGHAQTEGEREGLRVSPWIVPTRDSLAKVMNIMWFVCDQNGCCKK